MPAIMPNQSQALCGTGPFELIVRSWPPLIQQLLRCYLGGRRLAATLSLVIGSLPCQVVVADKQPLLHYHRPIGGAEQ